MTAFANAQINIGWIGIALEAHNVLCFVFASFNDAYICVYS